MVPEVAPQARAAVRPFARLGPPAEIIPARPWAHAAVHSCEAIGRGIRLQLLLIGACWSSRSLGNSSPLLPFTPTELEWRIFAGACETEAENSREQAAACPPEHAGKARDFLISAQRFESLAEQHMRNVKVARSRTADQG